MNVFTKSRSAKDHRWLLWKSIFASLKGSHTDKQLWLQSIIAAIAHELHLNNDSFSQSLLQSLLSQIAGKEQKVLITLLEKQQPTTSLVKQDKKQTPAPKIPQPISQKIEETYVENAGLVLLWMFLKPFFIDFGLVEAKAFIDEAAGERAALLLQFLVTGSTEIEEPELPLNKILCGIPWDAPLDPHLELSEAEEQKCEAFLQTILHRAPFWKKLSVPGLRQAYLQREGILTEASGWRLKAERKTYDVLTDRLPWGFKIVKLPWMTSPLYVEW